MKNNIICIIYAMKTKKTNEVKIIMSEFGSVCFYCVIVDVIHYYEDSFYASKNVNLHEGKYSLH